ncbi:MAG: 2-C-methyl-D-erythritol 4-phosphate cytidylyltransferase [Deltaproteobacteria bacterium HGW-Deltaproteobacteria-4]|nr:MAG: 2-C-methyl-D-erythritol 4-phosphate cytidylyltransferase [Deltaproteobacteria bacterium HGW-Deltaproteobacteria-4]
MANVAIIPAAGTGSRMQAGINKQYLLLAGRPILFHTLALFAAHPRIDRICIVVPSEEINYCRSEIVALYGLEKVSAIIAGGPSRQDSVANGLLGCNAEVDDLVVIHDGARPLLRATDLDALLNAAAKSGAAVLGVPVKDTIKQVQEGVIVATPERSSLWQVQTPQVFRYGLLLAAYGQARADGFTGTDDAMLVERLQYPVTMVPGSYRNIKITTPEDLSIASAFLATQGASS